MADSTAFTSPDRAKIRQAFGRMPYLGGRPNSILNPEDVDDLVETLDYLAGVLRNVAERASTDERDLRNLRSDVLAARRVLGLAPPPEEEDAETDDAAMEVARARAQWEIGDPSWADVIVGAYLRPDADAIALAREMEEPV